MFYKIISKVFLLCFIFNSIKPLEVWYDASSTANIPALDIYVFNEADKWPLMLERLGMANEMIDLAVKTAQSLPFDTFIDVFGNIGKKADDKKADDTKAVDKKVDDTKTDDKKADIGAALEISKENEKKEEKEKAIATAEEGKEADEIVSGTEKTKAAALKAADVIKITKWAINVAADFTNMFKKYFLNDTIKKQYTAANFKYVGKGNRGAGAQISWDKTNVSKDSLPGLYVVALEAMNDGKTLGQPLYQGYVPSNYRLDLKIDRNPEEEGYINITKETRLEGTPGTLIENKTAIKYRLTLGTDGSCPNYHVDVDATSSVEIPRKNNCKIKNVILYPEGSTRHKTSRIAPAVPSLNKNNEVDFKAQGDLLRVIINDDDSRYPYMPYVRVYPRAQPSRLRTQVIRDSRYHQSMNITEQ